MRECKEIAGEFATPTLQDGVQRAWGSVCLVTAYEVIPVNQGAGHVEVTFFQEDGAHPHTANVVLDVMHDVFHNRVL